MKKVAPNQISINSLKMMNRLERKVKEYLQHEAKMQLMKLKSEKVVLAEEN